MQYQKLGQHIPCGYTSILRNLGCTRSYDLISPDRSNEPLRMPWLGRKTSLVRAHLLFPPFQPALAPESIVPATWQAIEERPRAPLADRRRSTCAANCPPGHPSGIAHLPQISSFSSFRHSLISSCLSCAHSLLHPMLTVPLCTQTQSCSSCAATTTLMCPLTSDSRRTS